MDISRPQQASYNVIKKDFYKTEIYDKVLRLVDEFWTAHIERMGNIRETIHGNLMDNLILWLNIIYKLKNLSKSFSNKLKKICYTITST